MGRGKANIVKPIKAAGISLVSRKSTPSRSAVPRQGHVRQTWFSSPLAPLKEADTEEKTQTLKNLLGKEGVTDAEKWCIGFAHGTTYKAFLGMTNPGCTAILPYSKLPAGLRKSGRRNTWKQNGVFFRIVNRKRKIVDSVGSTGASGGVILFMPMDKSVELALYSLSSTDTQFMQAPVPPTKECFDNLKDSRNLSLAEIAFGQEIPLSSITKVFLSLTSNESESGDAANAAQWLLSNGFLKMEIVSNRNRQKYWWFERQNSEASSGALSSISS